MDMQTAYDIESQLLKISELTVITITYSLNPKLLENYDQVIFMDNGTISETSSYDELMENKGAFCDFVSFKCNKLNEAITVISGGVYLCS